MFSTNVLFFFVHFYLCFICLCFCFTFSTSSAFTCHSSSTNLRTKYNASLSSGKGGVTSLAEEGSVKYILLLCCFAFLTNSFTEIGSETSPQCYNHNTHSGIFSIKFFYIILKQTHPALVFLAVYILYDQLIQTMVEQQKFF